MSELYTFEEGLAEGRLVAGTDEVGAGPLAGPVVAAAVILPLDRCILGLNDSKQVPEKKRNELYQEIIASAVAYRIVEIDAADVDKLNVYWACVKAMSEAIVALPIKPELVLVDARPLPRLPFAQEAIIKGDARCASIAAASIVAKVHRDRLMDELHQKYPVYGFNKHKGYGTEEHLKALAEHGPCPYHRQTFAPVSNKQLAFGF